MVGFGQVICLPVSPRCEYVSSTYESLCAIGRARLCPSYKKVDQKTLSKRVPVYYVDGTVDRGEGRVPVAKDEPAVASSLEW